MAKSSGDLLDQSYHRKERGLTMISLPDADGLTVTVQTTNRCQLECPYCMATKNEDDMESAVVLRTLHDLIATIPCERSITFVWHGGEPLLRGVEFYEWILKIQEAVKGTRKNIRNVFQTNGLLLNEKFFRLVKESKDFHINISMDGPDAVTCVTRGVAAGKYDRLFERLRQNEIQFSVAIVASEAVLRHKDEVESYFASRNIKDIGLVPYHAFAHDLAEAPVTALRSVKGLPLVEQHITRNSPLPPPTILADLAITERSGELQHKVSSIGRTLVLGMLKQSVGHGCTLSSFDGACHKRVLCIATDGELYTCPRGQNVGLWRYGNVLNGGIAAWWATTQGPPPFRPNLPTKCEQCRFRELCHGGCPANAKSMSGDASMPDYYCPSFIAIFDMIEEATTSAIVNALQAPAPLD